jgi:uncharacterized membrane protein YvbJ
MVNMIHNRRAQDNNVLNNWMEWFIRLVLVGAVAFAMNTQRETSQAIQKLVEATNQNSREIVELKVKAAELSGKQAEMRGQFVSMEMMKRMELLFERLAAVSGRNGVPLKAMADVLKMEREGRSQ